MNSLLKGPRVLGLASLLGRSSFIRLFLYALLDLFQGTVGVPTIHQGVFLVSSFDLANSLNDQSRLGKDGLHLPKHLPLPGSQSLLCSWELHTDLGESPFLNATQTPQFPLEFLDCWEPSISSISENDEWSQELVVGLQGTCWGYSQVSPTFKCEQVTGFYDSVSQPQSSCW